MGDFSFDNFPPRSGSYTRFRIKQDESLPVSTAAIVATAFTHDWGPDSVPVLTQDLPDWVSVYGKGAVDYQPGFIAAYNTFKGEGPTREPGAGACLAYRLCGAAGAKAALTLQNSTPAAAITLTAIYKGTRGNGLKVAVVANPSNPATQKDLVVYEGAFELERFTFDNTNITMLANKINGVAPDGASSTKSGWLVASAVTSGVTLTNIAATSLVGGNDGAVLTAGDWTLYRNAMEAQRFAVISPYNLTDSAVITAFGAWAADLNSRPRSKRFALVVGGATGETYNDALTRTLTLANENVVNFGVGTYRDTKLTALADNGFQLSSAQLAPRLAGIIAQRGERHAISMAVLEDLEVDTGPTDAEITAGLTQGVVTVSLGSAGVKLERGVTTYTNNTSEKPKYVYGNLKYVMTMQGLERDINEDNEGGDLVGKLGVNKDTAEELVSRGRKHLRRRIDGDLKGSLQPGASLGLATDPPFSLDNDFIALDWNGKFGRALEKVGNTIYLS